LIFFDQVIQIAPRQLNVFRALYVIGDVLAHRGAVHTPTSHRQHPEQSWRRTRQGWTWGRSGDAIAAANLRASVANTHAEFTKIRRRYPSSR
jgi:hypothetical protein